MPTGERKSVSLPTPVYRRALRLARRQNQSVSELLVRLVDEKVAAETIVDHSRALEESFAIADRAAKRNPGARLHYEGKDDLHD